MAEANDLNVDEVKLKGMSIEWDIKDFTSLPQKKGQSLNRSFSLDNETWEVRIYPKGHSSTAYVALGIQLQTKDIQPQWVLTSALFIIEGKVIAERRGIDNLKGDNFLADFILVAKLLGSLCFSPDETVKVKCLFCNMQSSNGKISAASQTETIFDSINVLSDDIQNLYNNSELCDVKIKVGPKEFLAHRTILAARSTVFSSMFKHELIEKVNGVIDIPDFDPESFEDFLKFLYSGNVGSNETNYGNLYRIADKYCVNYLKRLCVDRMSETLEVETICDVLDLASMHDETQLLKNATTFFIKNAKCIFATENWRKFVLEKPSLSSEILIKLAERPQLIDN